VIGVLDILPETGCMFRVQPSCVVYGAACSRLGVSTYMCPVSVATIPSFLLELQTTGCGLQKSLLTVMLVFKKQWAALGLFLLFVLPPLSPTWSFPDSLKLWVDYYDVYGFRPLTPPSQFNLSLSPGICSSILHSHQECA